jgi:hypothetical protein
MGFKIGRLSYCVRTTDLRFAQWTGLKARSPLREWAMCAARSAGQSPSHHLD